VSTAPVGVAGLRLPWFGEDLELRPEGALHLPARGAVLVADLHLGKAHSFRRLGVPVPQGTTDELLVRLDGLLAGCGGARALVVLGDFLHAPAAQASPGARAWTAWRRTHAALDIVLVRGNHDRRAGDPAPALGIEVVDEPWPLGGLSLCHHPQRVAGRGVVCGHVHPGARLHGRGRDTLRLPCFSLDDGCLTLPAFGPFTGLHPVEAAEGRYRYVSDGRRVVALDGA